MDEICEQKQQFAPVASTCDSDVVIVTKFLPLDGGPHSYWLSRGQDRACGQRGRGVSLNTSHLGEDDAIKTSGLN